MRLVREASFSENVFEVREQHKKSDHGRYRETFLAATLVTSFQQPKNQTVWPQKRQRYVVAIIYLVYSLYDSFLGTYQQSRRSWPRACLFSLDFGLGSNSPLFIFDRLSSTMAGFHSSYMLGLPEATHNRR